MNPDEVIELQVVDGQADPKLAKPEIKLKLRREVDAYKKKLTDAGFKIVSERPRAATEEIVKKEREQSARAKDQAMMYKVASPTSSFVSGLGSGASLNAGDEFADAIGQPAIASQSRAQDELSQQNSPKAYAAGEAVGEFGIQALLSRLVPGANSTPGQMIMGGLTSGLSSLGKEDHILDYSDPITGEQVKGDKVGAAKRAALSAGGGALGALAGKAIAKTGSNILKKFVGEPATATIAEKAEKILKNDLAERLARVQTEIMEKKAAGADVSFLMDQQKILFDTIAKQFPDVASKIGMAASSAAGDLPAIADRSTQTDAIKEKRKQDALRVVREQEANPEGIARLTGQEIMSAPRPATSKEARELDDVIMLLEQDPNNEELQQEFEELRNKVAPKVQPGSARRGSL